MSSADAGAVQQPRTAHNGPGLPVPHGSLKRGQVKLLQRALVNTAVQRPAVCLLVDHGQPPRAATHTRALHALQERRGQRPRQAGVLGPGVGAASAQRAALQVHVRHVQQLCAAAARLPPERRAHAAGRLRVKRRCRRARRRKAGAPGRFLTVQAVDPQRRKAQPRDRRAGAKTGLFFQRQRVHKLLNGSVHGKILL